MALKLHCSSRAGNTGVPWEHAPPPPTNPPPPSPTFLRTKKKVRKRKKERVSKQKLLKGCHQDQNITVLAILERLEFEKFSCWPTMVADSTFQCSMTSPF